MRIEFKALFLIIILATACGPARYDGVYVGELRSESFRGNGTTIPGDGDATAESDLTMTVKQNADRITMVIARSRLLGDCELYFKVSKNGTAYVETPQTCTQSLPLEGTMDNKSGELNVTLRGFDSTSSKTFRFKGFKK